jgi:hypothetical protein
MSSGSRAARQNLKRLHPIPSDMIGRFFSADNQPQVRSRACVLGLRVEVSFDAVRAGAALSRGTVLKLKFALENRHCLTRSLRTIFKT